MIEIHEEEIILAETKQLWNIINNIKNDSDHHIEPEEYNKIKTGYNIIMPIWYLTEEWYEIYPNSKKVKVMGFGKFKLTDFMTEKEKRDNEMRRIILDNITDDNIVEGRT